MTDQVRWEGAQRLGGLRRLAIGITVLNLLGHAFLGFEQSPRVLFAALLAAYATELLLEAVEAVVLGRRPRYRGGIAEAVDFLLSAHVSGLAVGMLLYSNARIGPVVAAAVTAIASKSLIRAHVNGRPRHVMNPSNLGIVTTVLVFPWVGIAPPYQFTENLTSAGDWIMPAITIGTGTLLNAKFTHRLPLIGAWVAGFVAQALVRALASQAFADAFVAALIPMSGVAFVLFTFFMITDPATTPTAPRSQVAFGIAVAAMYGVLVVFHVVFGLFFALAIVSGARGAAIALTSVVDGRSVALERPPVPAGS